jgi:hypothetical protein
MDITDVLHQSRYVTLKFYNLEQVIGITYGRMYESCPP